MKAVTSGSAAAWGDGARPGGAGVRDDKPVDTAVTFRDCPLRDVQCAAAGDRREPGPSLQLWDQVLRSQIRAALQGGLGVAPVTGTSGSREQEDLQTGADRRVLTTPQKKKKKGKRGYFKFLIFYFVGPLSFFSFSRFFLTVQS